MWNNLTVLSDEDIRLVHEATLSILKRVGVRIHHAGVLQMLGDAGARVDLARQTARLNESMVMEAVDRAGKRYVLYGRDGSKVARFGYGEFVTLSSPGQYSWVDPDGKTRRATTSEDARRAITLGDRLPNIDIVGAMTQPIDVPTPIRDIWLTAELVKRTRKPTRCWVANGRTARYILEIYRTVAGGDTALCARPQIDAFVEPISPLQMPKSGMEILVEFTAAGMPVCFGPMVQAGATGPTTLAGTLAQENAENLAAIVITQVLRPGTPVMYGGICHISDMRTANISFGSAEQGLMAVAMAQMAKWYGFPVYLNAGLGDSKIVDAQAGLERGTNFALGVLAGGDLVGHMGISGADQGASLTQLVADNEMIGFVKRHMRGLDVNEETLAVGVIEEVGHDGQHLAHQHTIAHMRSEFWMPVLLDRQGWDTWSAAGGTTMQDRASSEVRRLLAMDAGDPLDERVAQEVDTIVESARRQLL